MAKSNDNGRLQLLISAVLVGGYCGFIIGQSYEQKRALERSRISNMERSISDLRRKVDPDYKDPMTPQSPIPVKVVSE